MKRIWRQQLFSVVLGEKRRMELLRRLICPN